MPWYGGKQYLVNDLLSLLPQQHEVYVEVFGGAAAVLFGKPPSPVETYNDLDSGLVNFFRVLRDPRRAQQLRQQLDLTPYAREEWSECCATWLDAPDEVEMARRWYMAVQGSFGKHLGSGTGWSFSKTRGHDKAHSFRAAIDELPRFTERLRHVQVDHDSFERVIRRYDGAETLLYCDPPYLPETRTRADRYRHELTREDHQRLLDMLHHAAGMVLLSGYRSEMYDLALAGWQRVDINTHVWSANGMRPKRTECVWLNPALVARRTNERRQASLWTGVTEGASA